MEKQYKQLEFQNRFLLNNYDRDEYKLSSLIISKKIIDYIQNKNIKSVMLFHNSMYEPDIEFVIDYCLSKHIDLYFAFYDKFEYIKYFKVNAKDSYTLNLYKYTLMPIPKNRKEITREVNADMLLIPTLAYDKTHKALDYEAGLIKLVWLRNDEIKHICCYAFSFQEVEISPSEDLIQVSMVFDDLEE